MKKIVPMIIFVLVIVGGILVWQQYSQSKSSGNQDNALVDRSDPGKGKDFFLFEIIIHKTFENGTYSITGSVDLPDPCYSIDSKVLVAESFPEQVMLQIDTPRTDEVCAQVITTKEFMVKFQASDKAIISGMLNGKGIKLKED